MSDKLRGRVTAPEGEAPYVHYKAPCAAPEGATACFSLVLPEEGLSDWGNPSDPEATCPKCRAVLQRIRGATNSRGVLKRGYKGGS